MKAILEFNLPEEESEFKMAATASDYSICLYEINQMFRKYVRSDYDEDKEFKEKSEDGTEKTMGPISVIDKLWTEFNEILASRNIDRSEI